MSTDPDYLLALEIQKRLNRERENDEDVEIIDFKPPPPSKKPLAYKPSRYKSNLDEDFLNRTQNLVHPQWETLDPTPDVHSMFQAFDAKFFQDRLKCVTLEWSKRMYSCAGICYQRRNRLGMEVTIRLSEPLLKLRPRKDLVETMLHEMIHAYCFVLHIREGNGGHGPNFKKIMHAINQVAGTNITVYHTFHDEVEVYKQHWWRCNGSCQNRSPFFGYVKRTCNRAPSINDQWWSTHQRECGGTFMKIKGPEVPPKLQKKANKKLAGATSGADMRKYLTNAVDDKLPTASSNTNAGRTANLPTNKGKFAAPVKSNGGGTLVLKPTNAKPGLSTAIASLFPPTSYPGLSTDPFNFNRSPNNNTNNKKTLPVLGNLRNVVGLRDLNAEPEGCGGDQQPNTAKPKEPAKPAMTGRGYSLTAGTKNTNVKAGGDVDRQHLRDMWAKRFESQNQPTIVIEEGIDCKKNGKTSREDFDDESAAPAAKKRPRLDKSADWVAIDEDVFLNDKQEVVELLSSDEDEPIATAAPVKLTQEQRQTAIKREILDESFDTELTDEDIILIDDDYNDDVIEPVNTLADTSVIDDLFGEDTLLKEFRAENDLQPVFSRHVPKPEDDIVTCPICQGKMKRSQFGEHIDGCTGIAVKMLLPKHLLKKIGNSSASKQLNPTRRSVTKRPSKKDILRDAGYSEEDLVNIASTSSEDENDLLNTSGLSNHANGTPSTGAESELDESTRRFRQRNILKTTRQCPCCAQEIEELEMNDHLDICLEK